ncbi:MAG: beta-galactosidase [Armatimonadota bacterium]
MSVARYSLLILGLLLIPAGLFAAGKPVAPAAAPVWNVPGDVPEMMKACQNIPALYNFSRNGYLSIECGYQAILLGNKIPIAPGPHVPWATPYGRKLKVLAIGMFGNAPADTEQLAQVARELDCDMRFVLVANVPVNHEFGKDEAYRLGFLAEQARAALKLEYDVILLAMGTYSPNHGYALVSPIFPDDVYQTILKKVDAGAGLVFVGSNMGGWWVDKTPLHAISPGTMAGGFHRLKEAKVTSDSPVFAGAPVENLPNLVTYNWKPREGATVLANESGRPLVMTGRYGKGRTVLFGWDGTLTPVGTSGERLQFEHGMAVTLRALTYAANAEPPVAVQPQPTSIKAGAPGTAIVKLSGPAQLACTLRLPSFEIHWAGKVAAQAGDARVVLPALPAGTYWLDVIARDARGTSLGWGSGKVIVTSDNTLALKTDKETYRPGETVTVTGTLATPEPGLRADIDIRDAAGRLLAQGPANIGKMDFTFRYPIADARVAPHEVLMTVYAGKAPVLAARTTFFVPDNGWHDYENMLWPTHPTEMNETMRDEGGFTAVMDGWGGDYMGKAGARVGIRPCRMNDGVISPADMQKDPAKGETAQDGTLKNAIDAARKYGSVVWALQDERHNMSDAGMPNTEGLRRYRDYLKTQYGTLEKLNASWGSAHADWEAIQPTLTKDLTPETNNLAPWVDFRLYVADQQFHADKRHAQMIRDALGANTPVGIDGFTSSGHNIPYGAIDIGRLLSEGVFNSYCPYGDDLMIASMVQGPMVKYIGWGMGRKDYFGLPWRDAFRGHWGTFRFFGRTFYSQFGWLQPAGKWTGEGTKELRGGAGKVLMGAKRQLDPVAILYSYPSMILTAAAGIWVEKGNAHMMWRPANWSRDAFERMLIANGNSFGYLTEAQVTQGMLNGKKLLIIPHFMGAALSDATCAAIKQFVADGGTVVADMAPAVFDEHGKLRAKGGLDDLFGVARDGFAYGQRTSDYLVGVTKDDPLVPQNGWYIGEWFEKSLKVTDGNALGKHWFVETPAMVVKQTGKGKALLLNFLHTSTVRRNGEPEDDDLKLMERILRASGVQPQAVIETDYGLQLRHCEINTLRDGATEYVGVYAQSMPDEDPAKVVIRFPSARETYDVRRGVYLGKVTTAPLPLRAQEAALFARLDYRITGVTALARSTERGLPVPVNIAVTGSSPLGRHVVNLTVTDPSGARHYFYSRNVEVMDGKYGGVIHTALNDPAGAWTITAREVISRQTATVTFRLR